MSDYEDENPYASPSSAAEPALPEIHGIWRDGDELVVLPRDMKAPKACWVTNRTRFVSRARLGCASLVQSMFGVLIPLTLIFAPCVGLLLLVVMWSFLLLKGLVRDGRTFAWLSLTATLRRFAGELVNIVLILINLVLWGLAWQSANLAMVLVVVPFGAITIVSFTYADRVLLGLYVVRGENHTIRVRGVHAGYLARLPAYNESDTATATAIEPGDSPFADPVP